MIKLFKLILQRAIGDAYTVTAKNIKTTSNPVMSIFNRDKLKCVTIITCGLNGTIEDDLNRNQKPILNRTG